MTRQQVRARIKEVGIIPAVRTSDEAGARFAAEAVYRGGIALAEIPMTVPGALDAIGQLRREFPDMVVGAGTVLGGETARRALDGGALFLTSPGFIPDVVELALKNGVVVFPGALSPSEVLAAWSAGSDFVKVFPCDPVGSFQYIRTLKAPFPQIPLIAAGGVNQHTAVEFFAAGAVAVGIGKELVPHEAIRKRNEAQIHELARRFLAMVKEGRARATDRI